MSGRAQDIVDLSETSSEFTVNMDEDMAVFAVQGPCTLAVLEQMGCSAALARLTYFEHAPVTIAEIKCTVGRLGFTGEAGFEFIVQRANADKLWARLIDHIDIAGFAAADILQIEAGFAPFCNDFAVPVLPDECGMERFAGTTHTPFDHPLCRNCFTAKSNLVPVLWQPEGPLVRPRNAGHIVVTSACMSERAGSVLGLDYARRADVRSKQSLFDPTGQFSDIRIQPLPFYDTAKQRPRLAWG